MLNLKGTLLNIRSALSPNKTLSPNKVIPCSLLAVAVSAAILPLASANESTSGYTVEEVMVTAQRRSESVQDVPIAITAVSGDSIEQMGMGNPIDVFAQTPNVTSQLPTGGTGSRFSISVALPWWTLQTPTKRQSPVMWMISTWAVPPSRMASFSI